MQSMQQLNAMPLNTHLGARAHGSHHGSRTDSPASTLSGSSPGTSQGKTSMDAERNARPFPNGFIQQPASDDIFLTAPNRRTASIPFSLPSQSQRTMAKPVSSSIISTFDSHTSSSPSSTRLDAYSSSFFAGAIAAHAAAADSTLQPLPPLKIQPTTTLSHSPLLPTSHLFPCCQRSQHLASCVQARDASSLHVLSERLDAPLPPVERVFRHPISLTPGPPSLYPAAPHLSASNLFPAKFSIEGVSARLSPAIITRQPQHPILSLPPISPISSPTENSRRLRSRSLRSVPALPMEGSEHLEPAEHDNAALDDFDEEEDGMVDGDEDADTASEDGESTSGPPSSETPNPRNLPVIDTSPLDLSFVDANTSGTVRRDDKTPKGSRMTDYFTSKLVEPASYSPLHSSRQLPASWTSTRTTPVIPTSMPSPSVLAASRGTSAMRALPTPTTPIINLRPSMYHHASRSMGDMSEILKRSHHTPELAAETPKSPLRNPFSKGDSLASETEELDTKLGPPLRRRLSMPTFGPSSAPPPYPHFRFGERGPTIQPRDEEGSERLPCYTNDIYLRAIMPRKMEFSAPGVQARDRKWRRTLCVLEGTAFRVYKCPPAAAKKGLIGNLWEKTVGVGDIAAPPTQTPASSAKAKEREQEREARESKFASVDVMPARSPTSPVSPSIMMASPISDEPEAQSSPSTRSRLLPSNFRRKNRNASDRSLTSSSEMGARRSFSSPQQVAPDSSSGRGVSLTTSANCSTSRTPSEFASPAAGSPRAPRSPRVRRQSLWVDDPAVPQPQEQNLVQAFALHSAESGLGSDYLKRRNVIRVRMEGQQFLLQAPDVASVVDWIEVRHF